MTTCPAYVPDLQAQGDCINCGCAWEYHSKEARKTMPTKDEGLTALDRLALHVENELSAPDMGDLLAEFRALQAENERLREKVEAGDALSFVKSIRAAILNASYHDDRDFDVAIEAVDTAITRTRAALGGDHD